jgi:hypothetical protein
VDDGSVFGSYGGDAGGGSSTPFHSPLSPVSSDSLSLAPTYPQSPPAPPTPTKSNRPSLFLTPGRPLHFFTVTSRDS